MIAAVGGVVVLRCIVTLFALSFSGPGGYWFAFWTEPVASLASLRSLLGTRGRVFLVHEAPSAAGLKKLRVAVPAALAANGFVVDDVRVASSGAKSVFGVVSRKSGR